MFAKPFFAVLVALPVVLAACQNASPALSSPALSSPTLGSTALGSTALGSTARAFGDDFTADEWASACAGRDAGKDGWDEPGPPFRIHGNTYYVGTCGIAAILVAGTAGHVLINGGTEAGGPLIAANIERLGFAPGEIKTLLLTHEHHDHAGGIAYLQRWSGARLLASTRAAPVLASGVAPSDDPQAGVLDPFPSAQVSDTLADGEVVRLGALEITAIATPGHAPGAMSYTWRSCADEGSGGGEDCRRIAYLDSLSAVSSPGYRFSDHPESVEMFRASLATVGKMECDIVLSPHPSSSRMGERIASGDLASGMDCRAYAAGASARLDARLADEASE